MKLKVRCVTAMLQPKVNDGPEFTMFRFTPADPMVAADNAVWYEGGLVIFTKEQGKYQVGNSYTFDLEVGK